MHHGHGNPYCESCAGPFCLLPRCSQGSAIHLAALHTHTKQSGGLLCSAWCLCVELLTALLYCMPTCRHAADVMASRRLQVCCSVPATICCYKHCVRGRPLAHCSVLKVVTVTK